jgi:hypothetical protein
LAASLDYGCAGCHGAEVTVAEIVAAENLAAEIMAGGAHECEGPRMNERSCSRLSISRFPHPFGVLDFVARFRALTLALPLKSAQALALPLAVAAILAPGLAEAACVVSSRTPPNPHIEAVTPEGLLKASPRGGSRMSFAVSQFVINQPNELPKLLAIASRANDLQLRAMAQGLRAVAEGCRKEYPMAAEDVGRLALHSSSSQLTQYFLSSDDAAGAPAATPAAALRPALPLALPPTSGSPPDLNQNLLADPFAPPQ